MTELANPSVMMMMMRVSSQNDLHQFVAEEWCGGLMRDKDYSKLEASSTMPHFYCFNVSQLHASKKIIAL